MHKLYIFAFSEMSPKQQNDSSLLWRIFSISVPSTCQFCIGLFSFQLFPNLSPKKTFQFSLNISLPESIMETCSVVLTFESVDEILWCDHSNETFSAVLLHGTICFLMFYRMKFGVFLEFRFLALLGVKRLKYEFNCEVVARFCVSACLQNNVPLFNLSQIAYIFQFFSSASLHSTKRCCK